MYQFPDGFEWLFPWRPLDDNYLVMNFGDPLDRKASINPPNQTLINELHREMVVGHMLFGEKGEAVAVHTLTHKDFVFTTAHPEKPIACVHLTWSIETDPTWPMTNAYETLDDWVTQMLLEHEEYKHLQPKHDRVKKLGLEW